MIDKIIYIKLMAVFIPVVVDASCLSDNNVSDNAVYLGKRKRFVICDLAAFAFEYESGSEALLLNRHFVLADL